MTDTSTAAVSSRSRATPLEEPASSLEEFDHPFRVLLLEDDDNDAEIVRLMLRREVEAQFEVTRVRNLAEAVRAAESEPFDVLIVDLMVPDAGGLEVVQTLAPLAPSKPIVVLTGFDDENARDQALRLGASEFVSKLGVSQVTLGRSVLFAMQRKRVSNQRHIILEEVADEARDLDAMARGLESLRASLSVERPASERTDALLNELIRLCHRCADRSARRRRQLGARDLLDEPSRSTV